MSQIPLFKSSVDGEVVVAYGGGVNTVAMLLMLHEQRRTPRAIVMSDPGDEWPDTIAYRDDVMRPWLASRGMPDITIVSRMTEAPFRPRAKNTPQTTLRGECMRINSLPSIAYGWKKCSLKYKAAPSLWWMERQPWIQELWARGERVVRAIGYDADEPERAYPEVPPDEERRFVPLYPLLDAGYGRDECVELIRSHGLPIPHKSACTFCPSNQIAEWAELRERFPERFADAIALEANAKIDAPDVVGLMRCMPNGKRQLRVWNGETADAAGAPSIPCECGT